MADLRVEDLTVEYESGTYVVRPLDRMNAEARSGELVLLLGPSGCGKTTFLSCLAGILRPKSGAIVVDDRRVDGLSGEALTRYRRETVGIVFQAFNLIPSLSALENVAVPLLAARVRRREARRRAEELLEKVALTDRMHHKPGDLSGGQQQRVAIARALAHDPPLLLADEPTAHLDYVQVDAILRLLRELAAPGRTLIVATHDPRMMPLADRVIDMSPDLGGTAEPQELSLEAGAIVFEQGSRGDLIYLVEHGAVDIVRPRADGTEEHVSTVGPGDYFGELGPLLGFPRSATARARTACRLTALPVREFRALFRDDPRLARLLGRSAAPAAAPAAPEPSETESSGAR